MDWHLCPSSPFSLFCINYLLSIKGPSLFVLWILSHKDLHPSVTAPPPLCWLILISIQFTLVSPFFLNYLILILYYPSTISHVSAPFFKSNILRAILTCSLHLTSNSVFKKNVSCMHMSKWYILIESNNLLRNFKTESKSLVIFPFSPSFLPWRQLLKSFSEFPWNSLETIGTLLFLVFMFYTVFLILSLWKMRIYLSSSITITHTHTHTHTHTNFIPSTSSASRSAILLIFMFIVYLIMSTCDLELTHVVKLLLVFLSSMVFFF